MLWVSPVSYEIAEAARRVAMTRPGFIHWICSVNHVGDNAYTGFGYREWHQFTRQCPVGMHCERDHLGKGNENLREWIDRDLEEGFTGVHLHMHEPDLDLFDDYHGKINLNLGPGEDDSRPTDPALWEAAKLYADWVSPNTGCKIDAMTNVGEFDPGLLPDIGVKIRGHNCDYLRAGTLTRVSQHLHGVNIAPQFGVVQSLAYILKARAWGFPIKEWEEACWVDAAHNYWLEYEHQRVQAIGHYHFDKLPWREQVQESVTRYLTNVIGTFAEAIECRQC
jgi:hypothetical protein